MKKGIIYYTHNEIDPVIFKKVQESILQSGLPIVSVSLQPTDFGKNIVLNETKGTIAYFKQITAALKGSEADFVFFCEHDVLYHPSHFEFEPTRADVYYFNINVWKMRWVDGFCVKVDKSEQVSGMVVHRQLALSFYQSKLKEIEEKGFDRHYEPKGERVDFESSQPNICIRHNDNLTPSRWKASEYRNKENAKGWKEDFINNIPGYENFILR